MSDTPTEATLVDANNILVASSDQRLGFDFFGSVVTLDELPDVSHKTVYLTGDISKLRGRELAGAARILVVKELSHGHDATHELVDLGRVPVAVGGVGVYYRRFFNDNYFERICAE